MALLSQFITAYGYPRDIFINNFNGYDKELSVINPLEFDGYYVDTIIENDNIKNVILYRMKNGERTLVHDIVTTHFYSSIIKNILFSESEDICYNMLLFVIYYRVGYTSHALLNQEISNIEMTERVIYYLVSIIKLLIDREHTTYRTNTYIGEYIDSLRKILTRERIQLGIKPNLNLRR